MKSKRYHGFIIEYQPRRNDFNPYWCIPYTKKNITGPRYFRYADSAWFETRELAITWGRTWREQGL